MRAPFFSQMVDIGYGLCLGHLRGWGIYCLDACRSTKFQESEAKCFPVFHVSSICNFQQLHASLSVRRLSAFTLGAWRRMGVCRTGKFAGACARFRPLHHWWFLYVWNFRRSASAFPGVVMLFDSRVQEMVREVLWILGETRDFQTSALSSFFCLISN